MNIGTAHEPQVSPPIHKGYTDTDILGDATTDRCTHILEDLLFVKGIHIY